MGITFAGLVLFFTVLFTRQYRYLFASLVAFFYGIIWTARTAPQFSSQLIEHANLLNILDFLFLLLLVAGLVFASIKRRTYDLPGLILSGLILQGKLIHKIYSTHIMRVVFTLDNSDIFAYMQKSSKILMIMEYVLIFIIFLTLLRLFIRINKPQ